MAPRVPPLHPRPQALTQNCLESEWALTSRPATLTAGHLTGTSNDVRPGPTLLQKRGVTTPMRSECHQWVTGGGRPLPLGHLLHQRRDLGWELSQRRLTSSPRSQLQTGETPGGEPGLSPPRLLAGGVAVLRADGGDTPNSEKAATAHGLSSETVPVLLSPLRPACASVQMLWSPPGQGT